MGWKRSLQVVRRCGSTASRPYLDRDVKKLGNGGKKGITISKKASQLWVSSDYSDKQRLQYLINPDVILYYKENNTLRTRRVNSLFTAISCLSYISAENKNGQPTQIDQNSRWVALPGIEPGSRASETRILSIVLQGHQINIYYFPKF